MSISRRKILSLGLGLSSGVFAFSRRGGAEAPKVKALSILILGGTGFLGPATIEAAKARGHRITMFNRGRTRPELFPTVEKLHGDRDPKKGEGLKALMGRQWDVVIDNSAYYPRIVSASATLLAPSVKRYILISSISAYKEPVPLNGDENSPLATIADPTVENMGKEFENYGPLKVLCEQAAEKAMPGRVTIVRPGYIVGPDDPTGRFTYWPVRIDRGGEVAIPGGPADPIQIIDVRDLGAWLVKLAEDGTIGTFNACGPEKPLSWGTLIDMCVKAGAGASKKPATLTWVPADFLEKQKEFEFPIWAPYQGETKGIHTFTPAKSVRAGLRFRAVDATVNDTLKWYKSQEQVEKGRTKLAGPTPEQEAKLLGAWKAAKSKG